MFRLKTYQSDGSIFEREKTLPTNINARGHVFFSKFSAKPAVLVGGTFTHRNPDESYFDTVTQQKDQAAIP